MTDFIQVLRQEHRNIESLLRVLERDLTLFDRGERPDYEVVLAIIDYFRDYPDSCHHPKEDMIVEKIKARDPVATATIGNLEAEKGEGTRRLRRAAEAQKGPSKELIDAIVEFKRRNPRVGCPRIAQEIRSPARAGRACSGRTIWSTVARPCGA